MADSSIDNWRVPLGTFTGPGRYPTKVNLPVSSKSVMTVSASEYSGWGEHPPTDDVIGGSRMVGAADVWVSNIGAHGKPGLHAGYVEFVLHLDGQFDNEIAVVADITRLHSSHDTEFFFHDKNPYDND